MLKTLTADTARGFYTMQILPAQKKQLIIDTLKKSEIFSILGDDELESISLLFEVLHFNKNEYIFIEGEPSDWIYVASEKSVKMVKHSAEYKDMILEIKVPGDIFCCSAVADKRPYPESALAMDDTSLIRISRKNFSNIIDQHPSIRNALTKYISEKLRAAHDMLQNITTERVSIRIGKLLLRLSEKAETEDSGYRRIDLPLTRQEIAEMVGTTRESCVRSMSEFQKQGIVITARDKILVQTDKLKTYLNHHI